MKLKINPHLKEPIRSSPKNIIEKHNSIPNKQMLGDSGEKKQEEPPNITRPSGGSHLPRLVGERGETWGREERDQEQELLNLRLAVK